MLDIRDGWDVPLEWLTDRQAVAQPPRGAVLRVLLKYARADRARLFALIDCARDDEALRLLADDEAPWRGQRAIFLLSRLSLEELAPALGASIRLRDQFGVSSLFR